MPKPCFLIPTEVRSNVKNILRRRREDDAYEDLIDVPDSQGQDNVRRENINKSIDNTGIKSVMCSNGAGKTFAIQDATEGIVRTCWHSTSHRQPRPGCGWMRLNIFD